MVHFICHKCHLSMLIAINIWAEIFFSYSKQRINHNRHGTTKTVWTFLGHICIYDVYCVILVMSSLVSEDDLPPDLDVTLGKWLHAQRQETRKEFEMLTKMYPAPDDPALLSHVRKVILPPATHKIIKMNNAVRDTPQSEAALSILKNKVLWFNQLKIWNLTGALLVTSTNDNWFSLIHISPRLTRLYYPDSHLA